MWMGRHPRHRGYCYRHCTVVQAPSCKCGAKRRGIWGLSIHAKKKTEPCGLSGPKCAGGSCDVLVEGHCRPKTISGTNGACYLESNGKAMRGGDSDRIKMRGRESSRSIPSSSRPENSLLPLLSALHPPTL